MRRHIIALTVGIGMLACASLNAASVTERDARNVARTFFGLTETKSSDLLRLVYEGKPKTKSSDVASPFYVYALDTSGFVIVSGEDVTLPILAYSTEHPFIVDGEFPENLAWWMDEIEKFICEIKSRGISQSQKAKDAWGELPTASAMNSNGKKLETALWGQDEPFNLLCPKVGGFKIVTGCAATATAIIMRYHQWPQQGTGKIIPGYYWTPKPGTQQEYNPERKLDYDYDWNAMPLDYSNGYSEREATAVAQLMADCGLMMKMKYDNGSSGAWPYPYYLYDYMGYDKSAAMFERKYYSDAEWIQKIENEIDNDRPVLLTGNSIDFKAGHAYVADGYDSENYISINWGWNGGFNGYYSMTPLGDKDETKFTKLYFEQNMVASIMPERGEKYKPQLQWMRDISDARLDIEEKEFAIGKQFHITMPKGSLTFPHHTTPTGEYDIEVIAAHCNKYGKVIEYISSPVSFIIDMITYNSTNFYAYPTKIQCTINHSVGYGDQIKLFYRMQGENEWSPVLGDERQRNSVIDLKDEETIAESTVLSYFSHDISVPTSLYFTENVRISIQSKPGVCYEILDSNGHIVVPKSGYMLGEDGDLGVGWYGYLDDYKTYYIDTSNLKGRYTIRMTKPLETFEFDIVL